MLTSSTYPLIERGKDKMVYIQIISTELMIGNLLTKTTSPIKFKDQVRHQSLD